MLECNRNVKERLTSECGNIVQLLLLLAAANRSACLAMLSQQAWHHKFVPEGVLHVATAATELTLLLCTPCHFMRPLRMALSCRVWLFLGKASLRCRALRHMLQTDEDEESSGAGVLGEHPMVWRLCDVCGSITGAFWKPCTAVISSHTFGSKSAHFFVLSMLTQHFV